MQYDDPAEIDQDRIEQWRLQTRLHLMAGDRVDAASDRVIISAITDRL